MTLMTGPSISISPRARLRTPRVPEDHHTPRVPWRVVSLSTQVLGDRRDGEEVAADSKTDPISFCDNPTRPANSMLSSSSAECGKKKKSSSSNLPAMPATDDKACSSCSRLESKRTLQGPGSLNVDELPRDLATAARTTRMEVIMGGDWQERHGSAKNKSSLQLTKPHIEVSFPDATRSSSAAAARLFVDAARGDRREWGAWPHFHAPNRVPVQPHGAATGRQDSLDATKMAEAPDTPIICEIRVPRAPPRPVGAPRPIWAVLRNRTLNATRREPSIFRGRSQNELENGVDAQQEEMTQRRQVSWCIFNRRIFGVREVPRRGVVAFPEWVMFSGGVPPSGLSEHSRWEVRIGRNRGHVPRGNNNVEPAGNRRGVQKQEHEELYTGQKLSWRRGLSHRVGRRVVKPAGTSLVPS